MPKLDNLQAHVLSGLRIFGNFQYKMRSRLILTFVFAVALNPVKSFAQQSGTGTTNNSLALDSVIVLGRTNTLSASNTAVFIGAGSVVTKPVKPFALVAGNPARQIGWMSRHGEKLDLPLSGDGEAACPATREKYVLKEGTCFAAAVPKAHG